MLSSPGMKRPISMFVLIHDFISYRSIILLRLVKIIPFR